MSFKWRNIIPRSLKPNLGGVRSNESYRFLDWTLRRPSNYAARRIHLDSNEEYDLPFTFHIVEIQRDFNVKAKVRNEKQNEFKTKDSYVRICI